jgi:Sigma-70, region 4
MEKLSPTERAAYILRKAFDHPYPDIAEILRLSEENTRQLFSRARKHIADERRAPVSAVEQNRLLQAFIAAAQTGDLAGLENLLAEQVVSYADGGGLVRAARSPVMGRERVAKFIAAVAPHFWKGVTLAPVEANGQAAVLISRDGAVVALATVNASAQGIEEILWMMRPSKLAAISSPGIRTRTGEAREPTSAAGFSWAGFDVDAKTWRGDLRGAWGTAGEILRCAPFLRQGRQNDGKTQAKAKAQAKGNGKWPS